MADSFNGISTFVVIDPSQERTAPLNYSIRPIPGGNTWYIDIGGQTGVQIKLLLLFTADSDYAAFELQRGNIGSLVCFDGTSSACLLDVRRTFRNPPGNAITAEATFVLL